MFPLKLCLKQQFLYLFLLWVTNFIDRKYNICYLLIWRSIVTNTILNNFKNAKRNLYVLMQKITVILSPDNFKILITVVQSLKWIADYILIINIIRMIMKYWTLLQLLFTAKFNKSIHKRIEDPRLFLCNSYSLV